MTEKKLDSQEQYEAKSREEVIDMYKEAMESHLVDKYIKSTKVLARPAKEGEKIITSIEGEERTKNRAKAGDFIVKNPSGEKYIVSREKFNKRYELSDEAPNIPDFKEYQAVGIVWGFQYDGPDIKIEAPWGEQQVVKSGDMIVSLNKNKYDNIYGIQLDVFKDTYKKWIQFD